MKLTKRAVDAADPGAARYIVWCGSLAGFGLVVPPSGKKSFVVRYRTEDGRDRRQTLGDYGVLTVDEARERARAILAAVASGADPLADRRAARAAATVGELLDRFLAEHAEPHLSPTTLARYRECVERRLKPGLGHLKVASLSTQDVAKLHYSLRSIPVTANLCRAVLSKAFSLAEAWGLRPEGLNPCRRVKKYAEPPRERFLSPEEIRRLGATLIRAEAEGLPWLVTAEGDRLKHVAPAEKQLVPVAPAVVAAIRLLLLTGARRGEILGLEWAHVDFPGETLALPTTKGRARRPHVVATAAFDLLSRLPRVEGSRFVFPRQSDPLRPMSAEVIQNGWERIRYAAGLADVRLHDLRHTYATTAARSGASAFGIRDALRHANVTTTGRYVNRDGEPERQLANTVGAVLESALDGKVAEIRRLLPRGV